MHWGKIYFELFRFTTTEVVTAVSLTNSCGFGGQHALHRRCTTKEDRDHWLDYADDTYDKKFISDVRAALRVMFLYLPLPFFWALYDQQGSRWNLQAQELDGKLVSTLLTCSFFFFDCPRLV